MENGLTHFDKEGNAVMVDVSGKNVTYRTALATGYIAVGPEIMACVTKGNVKKGDVLGVARVAGIMGVKKTSELIPMCHPLPIQKCAIDYELDQEKIFVYYDMLAKSIKGNLYIYNFPARSGHSIAPETLKKLVENNTNIKGLKDSVSEPNHTNELMLAVEGHEFEMFSGFDDQLLYNLTSGGVGCIGALSNIVPEIWSDLVKSTKEKDFDRVMKLSALTHELMPLYDMDSNFSLLFKKLMQHRGVEVSDRAIFPYNQMDEEVYKKAESLMDKVIEEYQNLK